MAYNSRQPYGQGQYNDNTFPEYNPYNNNPNQQHPTYDQAGFGKEGSYGQRSGFDHDEFNTNAPARSIRRFRFDERGALWTRGSRFGCVGRFCCCTLWITLLLLASILLSLVLWVQPPNVQIGGVQTNSTGGAISRTDNGFRINLYIPITVDNPNYFSVNLRQINADLTYPINNTDIGGGTLNDVVIESGSKNTTINFPLAIEYNQSADPNNRVLVDIGSKCLGGRGQLPIDYKITVGIRIGPVVISPSHADRFNVDCPAGDLLSGIGGLL
ncbi:hypothetical protein BDV98DRAFT_28086 [Pterulicium gracile]|uniref:Late embryogenesis abundant protein LEA-2 subgroup domain-containing protein n=1 Tax=Pterulicium gracile TaxID=1884261 RepID=A0A5C3R005_9AGAR|nr:hypothetical protein BDV98DRAFT_28086 [Pterula gracilis]